MNAIICAAVRNPETNEIVKGYRHFDMHMQCEFELKKLDALKFTEQGFMDKFGNFKNRIEAYEIVTTSGQYFDSERNVSTHKLYSEGIYE